MSDQIIGFLCGPPKDHKCDSDGPLIAIRRDGTEVLESEARKEPNFPVGFSGGSVSCSVCGRSAAEVGAWE